MARLVQLERVKMRLALARWQEQHIESAQHISGVCRLGAPANRYLTLQSEHDWATFLRALELRT